MIDLHIHTCNSDGSYSVLDILKMAENIGLDAISITDHNTLNAYSELNKINIEDYYSGQVINGCEIKCRFDGIAVEVLAYKFEDLSILSNWLEKYFSKEVMQNNQAKQLEYLKKVCNQLELKYDRELSITSSNPWGALSMIFNLIKYEENKSYLSNKVWDNPHLFYRECCCSKSDPFYVDETLQIPDINEVIEIITKAGGKSFLAHLYEYPIESYGSFIERLVNDTNIDGLECYQAFFSNEQIDFLINFCHKNNLLISGGTDFHGEFKPNNKLGIGQGNLKIPNSILEAW